MKRLTFAPVSSRILQRVAGYRPLEDFASEQIVICGGEIETMRPAIFLPDEISRITGVHEFSAGLEDEIHLVTRDGVQHTETIAYRFNDVCLSGSRLCNYRSFKRLTFGRLGIGTHWLDEIHDCVSLCSTDAGNDYFAHFLLDDLATAMLGQQFGRVIFGGSESPRTTHMLGYARLFNIPCTEVRGAWFKDLWLFKDYPQNSNRKERLRVMRSRLSAQFNMAQTAAAPAYIRRGTSGNTRLLENEAKIEELLAAKGFNVVDPEAATVAEICATLNGSPLIIGVEGSQLAHALLNLKDNGTLICIQPAARFNAVFRGFTNTLDLNWGFVVAGGDAQRFHLSPDRLLDTIELAMERA